jgi:hypothetical protein
MTLQREEAILLRDALLSAFTIQSLEQMLYFNLGQNYQEMVPPMANKRDAVFSVIQTAEREGWTDELVHAAHDDNPGNPKLKEFTQLYVRYQGAKPTLERIIQKSNSFLDVAEWRKKLERIERTVCSIEISGDHAGTGFLIGPDLVMTNYHVVVDLLGDAPAVQPQQVRLRFDFKKAEDGDVLNDGIRYPLHLPNWLVDSSRFGDAEAHNDFETLPAADRLDYAVLRVAPQEGNLPGHQAVLGSTDKERGWVAFPTQAPKLTPGGPLFIVQHPKGKSMKMALATDSIIKLNGNGTRVRHKTNTEAGSSGSACFNSNWDLVALHHAGDPNWNKPAAWNQAVPIWTIREYWQARGLLDHILSGAPPPAPAGSTNGEGETFSVEDELDDLLQN